MPTMSGHNFAGLSYIPFNLSKKYPNLIYFQCMVGGRVLYSARHLERRPTYLYNEREEADIIE